MLSTRGLPTRFDLAAPLLAALLSAGCSGSAPPSAQSPAPAAAPAGQGAPPATTAAAANTRETWDIVTIQGSRAGYLHTKISRGTHDGRPAIRVEGLNHLVLTRGGERSTQEIRFISLETPDGKLLQFQTETQFGPQPIETIGRVEGDKLRLLTKSLSKTENTEMDWKPDFGGLYAVELSLERDPLAPGQTRVIRSLLPGLNAVVTSTLTAGKYEPVQLLAGTYELLRIETQVQFADGTKLPGVIWTDRTGEILKNFSELLGLETFRATKAQALDEKDVGAYDLMTNLSVPLPRPMARGHDSKRVRYRVTLEGRDPAALFVSCPSQQVKSIDPHTAEITVTALRPGTAPRELAAAERKAYADDLRPNNHIQSDDSVVVGMAKQASAGLKDPWSIAVALERYVRANITLKNLKQAFATAAEVARIREGDCTEHALLLAALARACGIPARVAVGLVYVESPSSPLFGYHMWTEVFVDGTWVPTDATLARGGIGGGHLKLAHSNLKGSDAFSSFLPVLSLMGRLKIEVLAEE